MKNIKNDLKNSWTNYISILGLLLIAVFLTGCATASIADITNQDYVGKRVTVHGMVDNTVKIGDLSGYTLKDSTGTIRVSSETLPKEGTNMSVTGTLIKDTVFGYYIKVN